MAKRDQTGRETIRVATSESLKDAIDLEALRMKRVEGAKFRSERFQASHLCEAILLWYLSQPINSRKSIIAEGRQLARSGCVPTHDEDPRDTRGESESSRNARVRPKGTIETKLTESPKNRKKGPAKDKP